MSALRELLATFSFDVDTSALEAADGATSDVAQGLLDIGKNLVAAFAVGEIFKFGHETLELADNLAKQAQALGVSTEELQGWQHAAALSGSSAEEFAAAFTKFTRNVNEASEAAAGPAAKAFKELGVKVKDATGELGAPIDLLDGVVEGLQKIEDPAKRTALVMDLFGKSGARLLPLLSEGSEGIAKLRAEVGELGATYDEAFLENAQEFNDNTDRLKLGLRGLTIQVLGPLLPELVKLSEYLISGAKSLIAIVKQTNVGQAVFSGLAVKALPALTSGLRSLAGSVWRTVLPFLALDDALTFLAGGDSLIGRGLDKVFGAGAADESRKAILQWFTDVKNVVVNELLPAIAGIASSPLFKGAVKGALDGILAVLQGIGLALTDNQERAEKLAHSLRDHLHALGLGPSNAEVEALDKQREEGTIPQRAPLSTGENFLRNGLTTIFGDPLETPEYKARAAAYSEQVAKHRLEQDGVVSTPASPPIPHGEVAGAFAPTPFGPPTAPDWVSVFRPAQAALPAASTAVTNNISPTIAPATTINVKVEGRGTDAEVGNRVGKAAGKAFAPIDLKAVQAALVPTPG